MFEMQESYTLFRLFGMEVTSYAFFVTLGAALALVMALYRAKRLQVKSDVIANFTLIAIPLSLILARGVFCLCRMVDVMDYGVSYIFQLTSGGYSLMGVVVAVLIAALITGKINKICCLRVLDSVIPGLLMALAVARFAEGATFNGMGMEIRLSDGLKFAPIAMDGIFGEKVYSVYLGQGLTALIASVWAQGQYFDKNGRKHPNGWVAAMGTIIVAAAQYMWESARRDDLLKSGFVRYQMVFAGAILILLLIAATRFTGYSVKRTVITWLVFALCIGMNVFVEFLIDGKVIQKVPIWLCYLTSSSCAAIAGALTMHAVSSALRRRNCNC